MSFLNDKNKMIDFFNMGRSMFLESYDYLTEDDYTATVREICNKVKFNDYKDYDYKTCEGMWLGNVVYAAIMFEYLNR